MEGGSTAMLHTNLAMTGGRLTGCIVATLLAVSLSEVQGQQDSASVVAVRVVPAASEVPPGAEVVVAVVMEIREGWHINSESPRLPPALDFFQAIPTTIRVDVPAGGGITADTNRIQWPPEEEASLAFLGESATYGVFAGTAIAYLPLNVDDEAPSGPVAFAVGVEFQACSDTACLAPAAGRPVTVRLTIAAEAPRPTTDDRLFAAYAPDREARADGGDVVFALLGGDIRVTPQGLVGGMFFLLLAALGGFSLNLMPCVLPVIPIKVMALSQAAADRRRCALLGVAMALGVVAFWLALGVAMATVAGLTTINGLYQFPLFTIGIGLFIAAMAVSMCGLFDARLPGWIYALDPSRETLVGATGYGVMTAVLATPCAAPFMGTAVAWSLQESPAWVLATFFAIGGGMALPYVVLTAFPGLLHRVPRSGPGSLLLKQVMGLLMLSAAVYFVGAGMSGLLAGDDGRTTRAYWYAVGGGVAAAGIWMVVRSVGMHVAPLRRGGLIALGIALVFVAVAGARALTHPGPIAWRYYTPDRYAAALRKGNAVMLDFTAETCINCKVLEHMVLHDPRVVAVLGDPGVVPMKVDLTGKNPAGWDKLQSVGSVHIPRLVIVDPQGRETINAEVYSVEQVLMAIEDARKGARGHGK